MNLNLYLNLFNYRIKILFFIAEIWAKLLYFLKCTVIRIQLRAATTEFEILLFLMLLFWHKKNLFPINQLLIESLNFHRFLNTELNFGKSYFPSFTQNRVLCMIFRHIFHWFSNKNALLVYFSVDPLLILLLKTIL